MVVSLVNGGALVDYRTKDGLTPMHRAVQANNYEAVKTLLGKWSPSASNVLIIITCMTNGLFALRFRSVSELP